MIFQNSKLVPVLANRQDAYFGPFSFVSSLPGKPTDHLLYLLLILVL
jgi:hypothetical protein